MVILVKFGQSKALVVTITVTKECTTTVGIQAERNFLEYDAITTTRKLNTARFRDVMQLMTAKKVTLWVNPIPEQ